MEHWDRPDELTDALRLLDQRASQLNLEDSNRRGRRASAEQNCGGGFMSGSVNDDGGSAAFPGDLAQGLSDEAMLVSP